MIPLIDIIKADNARYRQLLEVFQQLADVTLEGPPKGADHEGSERVAAATQPAADGPAADK